MNKTTAKWGLILGMVGTGVVANVIAGCGKNACETLADDLKAKYAACGITATATATGTSTGTAQSCTGSVQTQATCLDQCVPKIDCECTKNPTGAGCADKLKPYSDCALACLK